MRLLEFGLEIVNEPHYLLAVLIDQPALWSQLQFSPGPVQKQPFEVSLQGRDELTDRGLGDLVYLGRPGKTVRFRQVAKHLKAFDLHHLNQPHNPNLVKERHRGRISTIDI